MRGGRGAAFGPRRQLGCGERGSVHDVVLARLERLEAEVRKCLANDDGAGRDHRRSVGVHAAEPLDLLDAHLLEPLGPRSYGLGGKPVAVHDLGVFLLQAQIEGGDRRDRPGDASDAPEPPDCKGQKHHIISRAIAKALENHPTLRGLYKARDPRFVAQAKDEAAHCGYQDWHRKVDQEVVGWLKSRDAATPKQFEEFLRSIYNRPEMRARFPLGF